MNTDEKQNVCAQKLPDHHKKLEYCLTRKAYRRGRKKTAVKVFTVNSESKYIIVTNVHSTGLERDLVKLCSKYGTVERYQDLTSYPREQFTQAFLIKYQDIQSARIAKRHIDEMYFFGSMLHVFYGPEYESVEETRQKLTQRRISVVSRVKSLLREERSKIKGTSSKSSENTTLEKKALKNSSTSGSFSHLSSTVTHHAIVPHIHTNHPPTFGFPPLPPPPPPDQSVPPPPPQLNGSPLVGQLRGPNGNYNASTSQQKNSGKMTKKTNYIKANSLQNINFPRTNISNPNVKWSGGYPRPVSGPPRFLPRTVQRKCPRSTHNKSAQGNVKYTEGSATADNSELKPMTEEQIYFDNSPGISVVTTKKALKRSASGTREENDVSLNKRKILKS